jgi:hypothetical protein
MEAAHSSEMMITAYQTKRYHVGFEVLTVVVMKSTIFWDIMPCSPLKSTDVSEEHIASIFRVEE